MIWHQLGILTILGVLHTRPQLATALWCYETNAVTNEINVRKCDGCQYCVISTDGSAGSYAALFSVNSSVEDLSVYNLLFSRGKDLQGAYQVLTLCVFEKYSLGIDEYVLRCLCKRDFCNKAMNIPMFLERQAKMSTFAKMKNVKKMEKFDEEPNEFFNKKT